MNVKDVSELLKIFDSGISPSVVITALIIITISVPAIISTLYSASKTTIDRSNWKVSKIKNLGALLSNIDNTAPIVAEAMFKELVSVALTYPEIRAFAKAKMQMKLLNVLRHKKIMLRVSDNAENFIFTVIPTKKWINAEYRNLLLFISMFIYTAIDVSSTSPPLFSGKGCWIIVALIGYTVTFAAQWRHISVIKCALELYDNGEVIGV